MLQQRRGRGGGGRRCRLNGTAHTFVIRVGAAGLGFRVAAAAAAGRHARTQMQNVASGSKQSKREGTEVANSKHKERPSWADWIGEQLAVSRVCVSLSTKKWRTCHPTGLKYLGSCKNCSVFEAGVIKCLKSFPLSNIVAWFMHRSSIGTMHGASKPCCVD